MDGVPECGVDRLSLSLMRDFQLRRGNQALDLAPSSQRLIGFLALQGRAARRTFVSGTLWLNAADSRAGANMRSALWRLPALEHGALVGTSATHIWLDPAVQVDLSTLTAQAVAVLDGQVDGTQLVPVARQLCKAGDDLLPGWYDEWVVSERERLRQLRLHALDRIGQQLLADRLTAEALQVGLAMLATEPLRESGHRLLMRVHLSEGNVAEAIRQYRIISRLLREELGVRPSGATESLLRECVGETAGRPAATARAALPTRDGGAAHATGRAAKPVRTVTVLPVATPG